MARANKHAHAEQAADPARQVLPWIAGGAAKPGRTALRIAAIIGLLCVSSCSEDAPTGSCPTHELASLRIVNDAGVPIVQATVQGRALFFIVDTGDETSMLSDAAAGRIGLDVGSAGTYAINGTGGQFRAPAVTAEQVGLGTDTLRAVTFAVAGDFGKSRNGIQVDGLLGSDILSRYDVDFDLPHHRIGLHPGHGCEPGWPEAPHTDGIPFVWEADHSVHVRVGLNGRAVEALLDSGAQHTVLAENDLTSRELAAVPASGRTTTATGIDGHRIPLRRFPLRSLQIDVIRRADLEAMSADLPSTLIGADLFRSSRIWISYSRRRLFTNDALPAGH